MNLQIESAEAFKQNSRAWKRPSTVRPHMSSGNIQGESLSECRFTWLSGKLLYTSEWSFIEEHCALKELLPGM